MDPQLDVFPGRLGPGPAPVAPPPQEPKPAGMPCSRCANSAFGPGVTDNPNVIGWATCPVCLGTGLEPAFPARRAWRVRNVQTGRTLAITAHAQERWAELAQTGEAEMQTALERAVPFGAQLSGPRKRVYQPGHKPRRANGSGLLLLDDATGLAFPVNDDAVVTVLTHEHAVANVQAFIRTPSQVRDAYRRNAALQLASPPVSRSATSVKPKPDPIPHPPAKPSSGGGGDANAWAGEARAFVRAKPASAEGLDHAALETLRAEAERLRGTAGTGNKIAHKDLFAELGRILVFAQRSQAHLRRNDKQEQHALRLQHEVSALRLAIREVAGRFLGDRILERATEFREAAERREREIVEAANSTNPENPENADARIQPDA